ncbi:hypothetical protein HYR99_39185 [Candidatus Poribacteria bacterium]|nr:hypothetical protein [Candidatus Poribacteria bacterium]
MRYFINMELVLTAPASGGCWVIDGDDVLLVTADGKKSDIVLGYEGIPSLSRNLSDGTFWITDQGGSAFQRYLTMKMKPFWQ